MSNVNMPTYETATELLIIERQKQLSEFRESGKRVAQDAMLDTAGKVALTQQIESRLAEIQGRVKFLSQATNGVQKDAELDLLVEKGQAYMKAELGVLELEDRNLNKRLKALYPY